MAARKPKQVAEPVETDREQQFLQAALDLFVRKSFAVVTIKDIAKGCDANPALLYYYFKNKEDLYAKAIDYAISELIAAYEGVATRHDDPVLLINDWLDVHKRMPSSIRKLIKLMMDDSGEMRSMKEMRKNVQRFYSFERSLITTAIADGVKAKRFRKVDPAQVAEFASLHLDGIIAHSIIEESAEINKGIENFKNVFWNLLLL